MAIYREKLSFAKHLKAGLIAARKGGALQKKHYGGNFTVYRKEGWANLVTEIDFECQKAIIGSLRKTFPDHDFLAEEKGALRQKSPYRWIIDPIDGTTNFTRGFPFFCVSIGLEWNGKMVMGIVHEALRDETFTAIRGQGSRMNGRKIQVDPSTRLDRSVATTGFSYRKDLVERNIPYFEAAVRNFQAMRRTGSAALDLCYVACGRTHTYWDLSLQPWDVSAGMLIVEEAGGRVSQLNGSKYSIYNPDILATNGRLHSKVVRMFKKFHY